MTDMRFRRIAVIVLDSVGIGGAPDAARFGDEGSDTVGGVLDAAGLALPTLCGLGLANLTRLAHDGEVIGAWGVLAEASAGKDTMTGHFEIAGLRLDFEYPTYPGGFPPDLLEAFSAAAGVDGVLGNCAASGTEIIARLGSDHIRTGRPIVYTSADSVFQVAAHTGVVPLAELYRMCELARGLLAPPHNVARVIARPFTGEPEAFTRTKERRDWALEPPGPTALDRLAAAGLDVLAVGKIGDIFSGRGITRSVDVKGNPACIEATRSELDGDFTGLLFVNLVDFDMNHGHRRDPQGYRDCLQEFDVALGAILSRLRDRDLLLVTADHGCDPTFRGTDHTRERVPLLAAGPRVRPGDLGTHPTYAVVAATILANFGLKPLGDVTSLLSLM